MSVTLELPSRLLAKLKSISEARDSPLEEIILEAVYEYAELSDPKAKAELHLRLCEKYLKEGEELLANKDYVQAGEKLWGASSQIVKAVASRRGLTLDTHARLWEFVGRLRTELEDPELGRLWSSANALHKNFYEAHIPEKLVEDYAEDVRKFIEKLRKLVLS